MSIRSLLERRASIKTELETINAAHPAALPPEAQQKWDALTTELTGLESRMARQAAVDDLDRRITGQPITGTGDRHLDQEMRNFSIVRAIASQVPGIDVDAGREREISQETARRAGRTFQGMAIPMAALSLERRIVTTALPGGGPGSNIIGTDYRPQDFIDALRARTIVRRLGARVLGGLTGNVSIPKLKTSATVGWVAENSALTPSDQEYASVTLTPKHAGGIVEFSRNMLLQSSPDIEQLVRNDFAGLLAGVVDTVAFEGGGANEPTGIIANGSVDGTTSMSDPWSGVLDLIEKVELANTDGESLAFVMNPHAVRVLRDVPQGWTDKPIMDAPGQLAGYPAAVSSLVPDASASQTTIIFGNWSDLLIGFWSELDILTNPYESTAYSKGNVQVRAMMTCDIDLRHTESFVYADDLGY